jgi:hypothetical protein
MKPHELLRIAKPMRLAQFLSQRRSEQGIPIYEPKSYNDSVIIEFDEIEPGKGKMDWEDFSKVNYSNLDEDIGIKVLHDESGKTEHEPPEPPEPEDQSNFLGEIYIRKPQILKSYYLEHDKANAITRHGNIRAHHRDILLCPDCKSQYRRNQQWHHLRTLKHQTVVKAGRQMIQAMQLVQEKVKKLPRRYRNLV